MLKLIEGGFVRSGFCPGFEFYGDIINSHKLLVKLIFSVQFKKKCHTLQNDRLQLGYVMVNWFVNPIMNVNFASLFNCTMAGRSSD